MTVVYPGGSFKNNGWKITLLRVVPEGDELVAEIFLLATNDHLISPGIKKGEAFFLKRKKTEILPFGGVKISDIITKRIGKQACVYRVVFESLVPKTPNPHLFGG